MARFVSRACSPGRYNVDVTLNGFAPLKMTDVSLAPAEVQEPREDRS